MSDINESLIANDEKNRYEEEKRRNKQRLVRNEFKGVGKYWLPLIKKQEIDVDKIELYSYNNIKYNDSKNKSKTIHFFIDDYKFEGVYKNAEYAVNKIKQYYEVCSPDFSLYTDMPILLQMYSTFKNRWCGAYFQSLGIKVIPTISWSDERSFEFCFEGIEKGSVVAVSTHGNHRAKEEFMSGYEKMLEVLEPSSIICYGKPFPETRGNIKKFLYNPYEHSEANHVD